MLKKKKKSQFHQHHLVTTCVARVGNTPNDHFAE